MLENQYKYEKEHPDEMAEAKEYLENASMEENIVWFLNKMRPSLFIPTPGPDGKPIECEVRCRGCNNVEECSHIQHPEILVSRILDESTNRYTCYEENIK